MNRSIFYFTLLFATSIIFSCQKEEPKEEEIIDTCVNSSNVVSFQSAGKQYELVKEKKTWREAAICAIDRGGYLVEVNDATEQNAVYSTLTSNISDFSVIVASDGGDGSYVWLGGNDFVTEGNWIWDGNSDGEGEQFWAGNFAGKAVEDRYENWGREPDNFQGQNALAIGVTNWPKGMAGEWNDIKAGNKLYFVVEFD